MPLRKISFAPTINKNVTEYAAEGYYVSCDKVRFRNEKPEAIGGWARALFSYDEDYNKEGTTFNGTPRQLFSWADLLGGSYTVAGTESKVEILYNGIVYDVTPLSEAVTAGSVSVVNTSTGAFEVSLNSHDTSVGDYVVFTSFTDTSIASINTEALEKQFLITSVVDANHFIVETSAAFTTAVSAGGVTVNKLLGSGLTDFTYAYGYGAGTYGTPGVSVSAGYNEPRGVEDSGIGIELRQWSFVNWGEDLIASPRKGAVYLWDKTNGLESSEITRSDVRLALVSAPEENNFIGLSEASRQLLLFGTQDAATSVFDPMLVRWCDFEDYTEWTATVSNGAGDYRLPSGSEITFVSNTKRESLIVTDRPVYVMQFVGQPEVFAFDKVGDNASAVSKNAGAEVNGRVFWMGYNSFYEYDGSVRTLPCDIEQFLFAENSEGFINFEQREKIYCGTNNLFNEIWWHYPDKNSEENNRYVIYNYISGSWAYGFLDRTSWSDFGLDIYPLATDSSGNLFLHENGKTNDGTAIKSFIVSSFFDIGDGDVLMFIDRLIPDIDSDKEVNFSIEAKKYLNCSECVEKGPYAIAPSKNKQDFRIRGRVAKVRFSTSLTDNFWRLGDNRLRINLDGER